MAESIEDQIVGPEVRRLVSTVALLIGNLVPLYGVLFLNWDAASIIKIYWAENVVTWFFNILRMLMVPTDSIVGFIVKIFRTVFFAFHFGIFTAVHGVFVLLALPMILGSRNQEWNAARPLELGSMWIAITALFISHSISFLVNYLGHGEYRHANLDSLMNMPYRRVIVLHLTILFGAFIIAKTGSPPLVVLLLVVLKTGIDIFGHRNERRHYETRAMEARASQNPIADAIEKVNERMATEARDWRAWPP